MTSAAAALFDRREAPVRELAAQASAVAAACHAMALRFRRGGRLISFGTGAASADAQHVAVEFTHPVIVGKRALPAISLTSDVATVTGIAAREGTDAVFARQLECLAGPDDVALGITTGGAGAGSVLAGLAAARRVGLLTVALAGTGGGALAGLAAADHLITCSARDELIVSEVQVTTYHVLWELVHVFLEQPPGVIA